MAFYLRTMQINDEIVGNIPHIPSNENIIPVLHTFNKNESELDIQNIQGNL